jgi:hypothetical protein
MAPQLLRYQSAGVRLGVFHYKSHPQTVTSHITTRRRPNLRLRSYRFGSPSSTPRPPSTSETVNRFIPRQHHTRFQTTLNFESQWPTSLAYQNVPSRPVSPTDPRLHMWAPTSPLTTITTSRLSEMARMNGGPRYISYTYIHFMNLNPNAIFFAGRERHPPLGQTVPNRPCRRVRDWRHCLVPRGWSERLVQLCRPMGIQAPQQG